MTPFLKKLFCFKEERQRQQPDLSHAVFLAIDVQTGFCNSLSLGRSIHFPRRIIRFSEELRDIDIPTIWVAMQESSGFCGVIPPVAEHKLVHPRINRDYLVNNLGFADFTPKKDEAIFIKNKANVFATGSLDSYLRNHHINTLIVGGINTLACVAASILGGIKKDFACIGLYDQMAESLAPMNNESSPSAHFSALEPLAKNKKKTFDLLTSHEVLVQAKRNPARSKRSAPGPFRIEWAPPLCRP